MTHPKHAAAAAGRHNPRRRCLICMKSEIADFGVGLGDGVSAMLSISSIQCGINSNAEGANQASEGATLAVIAQSQENPVLDAAFTLALLAARHSR